MPTYPQSTSDSDLELQSFSKPTNDLSSPAGFAAPPFIYLERQQVDQATLLSTASRVTQDPLLLRRLSDRVYELMLEDLRYQRERSRNYGSRLNA